MKFLANMPISPETVYYLRSLGHDIYRINEKGLPKAKDHEIAELAIKEQGNFQFYKNKFALHGFC